MNGIREMSSKLTVDLYDHGYFMTEVTELVETILGYPISPNDNALRLISEARDKVNGMFARLNKAQPVADHEQNS